MLPDHSIYMPPVEIPGWGQIHGEILQDAVTEADRILALSGSYSWTLSQMGTRLKEIVSAHTWRSEAAQNMLMLLTEGALAEAREKITEIIQENQYATPHPNLPVRLPQSETIG